MKAFARALLINAGVTTLAVGAVVFAARAAQVFKGTITDDVCARADHSQMRMGPTDAECAAACIDAHGALYILFDGDSAYNLSDQRLAARFAAQKVEVTGTLESKTKTIQVDSISAAR